MANKEFDYATSITGLCLLCVILMLAIVGVQHCNKKPAATGVSTTTTTFDRFRDTRVVLREGEWNKFINLHDESRPKKKWKWNWFN